MWDKILHQGKTVLTPAAWQTFIYLNNPDVIRQKEEVFWLSSSSIRGLWTLECLTHDLQLSSRRQT